MNVSNNKLLYIDITRLVRRQCQKLMPTGIDRVMLAYIQYYQDKAYAFFYYLGKGWILPRADSKKIFLLLLAGESKLKLLTKLFISLAASTIQKKKYGSILLALGHSNLEKKTYIKAISRLKLKPIFFIHDLIPITHPEYCRVGEKEKHLSRITNALISAKGIIVNSKVTEKVLSDFGASIQRNLPSTAIAHLGAELSQSHSQKNNTFINPIEDSLQGNLNSPYFVVLGTIEPRKNHLLLLYIWKKLINIMGKKAPRLVILGRRGWECEHVTRMLDRCTLFQGFIFEWDRCSDEQLLACLQGSQALLFPSFVEGYGLPLIEALAAGIPVIASATPVFRELAYNVPEYVDQLDATQWMRLVTDYTDSNSLLRKAQLERLANYKAPNWVNHFSVVDKFLQSMVK